ESDRSQRRLPVLPTPRRVVSRMTKRARGTARPPTTLWIPSASLDRQLLDYTAIEDRLWDARLLAWDIFGSLGHVESLRASKLLSPAEYRRIRTGLRAALAE